MHNTYYIEVMVEKCRNDIFKQDMNYFFNYSDNKVIHIFKLS